MTRYDYRCTSCNTVFEVEHPMSEHPHVTCPTCGADATRVFAPGGISFKGSGFYNTDQRSDASAATPSTTGSQPSSETFAPCPAASDNRSCATCEHAVN